MVGPSRAAARRLDGRGRLHGSWTVNSGSPIARSRGRISGGRTAWLDLRWLDLVDESPVARPRGWISGG